MRLTLAVAALATALIGAGAHSASAQSFVQSGTGSFTFSKGYTTGSFNFYVPGTYNGAAGKLSGMGSFKTATDTGTSVLTYNDVFKFAPTKSMPYQLGTGYTTGSLGISSISGQTVLTISALYPSKPVTFAFDTPTGTTLSKSTCVTLKGVAPAPELSSVVSFGGLLLLGGAVAFRGRRKATVA